MLRTSDRVLRNQACIDAPTDVNEEVRVNEGVGELTNHTLEIAGVNETQVKEMADLSFKPNPYQRRKAKEAVEMRVVRPRRNRKKPGRLGYQFRLKL